MSTGRAVEVQSRRNRCEIALMLSQGTIFVITIVILVFCALLHVSVHRTNDCEMTYMYRKLQFLELPMKYAPTNKYTLSVYNEGRHWWNVDIIEPGQIPVLFIPGSQGSAKQIRSLASLVQNKTESRRSLFSFRFFAVDFDEEVTFMNGNIMNRQLDYVMNAMRYIQKMMRVPRKIVLVGHSYGGMLAVLTTIHRDYQNDTELLILKGAPINKQPVIIDWLSLRLNLFLTEQWNILQTTTLNRLGVVAYSGGLRDFQIPDSWSTMRNISHYPVWAIDGVSHLGCDHLSILWCNEFVRHVSRVLFSYAENLGKLSGREVVQNFYKDDKEKNMKRANLTRNVSELPYKEIYIGETYKGVEIEEKQFALLLRPHRYQVLWVGVNGSCVNTMTTVRNEESWMHFQNGTDGAVETWIYRATPGEKVRLVLDVSTPCKVDIQLSYSFSVNMWRFYEVLFSHILEVGGTFIISCTFFAVVSRESRLYLVCLILLINIAAIAAAVHGTVDSSNTLAIPIAIGYFMALGYWLIVTVIDKIILSRLTFITRIHKAIRDDKLFNGIFLVCGAVTVMASSEGTIFLLIFLSLRHSPKSVLLVIPAMVPHCLKLYGFRLFSLDNQVFYELQYHPAFYAACIYMWGMMGNPKMAQFTMRCLIYGLTPALLYLLSSPLELYSSYALLVLTAARFVIYGGTPTENDGDTSDSNVSKNKKLK